MDLKHPNSVSEKKEKKSFHLEQPSLCICLLSLQREVSLVKAGSTIVYGYKRKYLKSHLEP